MLLFYKSMLRITVELIPHGDESRKRKIAIGEIANDGSGSVETGNYRCWFSKFAPQTYEVWKHGTVEDFPRQRLGHWDLLYRALRSAVGARNRD